MKTRWTAFLYVYGLLFLLQPAVEPPASACLLAERLRVMMPQATEEEINALAHGGMVKKIIPYELTESHPCKGGMADIFPCEFVDLVGFLRLEDIGGGDGNDIWGWTDPDTGQEYAIIGRTNGTSFVDVSDPTQPIFLGELPTHNGETSDWRDMKVYQNHVFIVADRVPTHGMQVFDLTQLRNVAEPPATFEPTTRFTGFNSAHNIAINEDSGFAYAVGGDTCTGGPHMVDIRDPANPQDAGCFSSDGYTHDLQCVNYDGPDTEHNGKEICFAANEDTITIIDVTDKSAPVMLSRTDSITPGTQGYTHQGWLTEDKRYFVHDDELDELSSGHNTRTYVWDMLDIDNPVQTGYTDAEGEQRSVDHNQYIKGQHTYQANYTRGLRILELTDPASGTLTEVAYFDSFPDETFEPFSGAWSTYPYFDSGIVLVSDINRGLFIVRPRFEEARVFRDGFESGSTDAWTETTP